VRLTAQLIVSLDGSHVWADRFGGDLDCSVAGQDQDWMMFMTIIRTAGLSLAGAIVGLWACAGAQAETFKTTSGRAIYVPVSTDATKQADGSTVLRMSTTGISTADVEKHQCSASAHIAADGKSRRTCGYCEILSSKGDREA
jgi:hypothetical protein